MSFINKLIRCKSTLKAFLPNSVNKQVQEAKRIKKGSEATDISDVIEFLKPRCKAVPTLLFKRLII